MAAKSGYTIAISGKGGTGKTVISAILVKLLSEKSDIKLLAIDADPATSLPYALGVKFDRTMGDIREKTYDDARNPDAAVGNMPLDMLIENDLQNVMVADPEFSLLVMGRPEGPGCYCLINNMMRHIIDKISRKYDVTLVDCEAGLEHLSRRTIRDVDLLFMVTDPTTRGMNTAQSIKKLSKSLDVVFGRTCLVVNKVTEEDRASFELADDVCGLVPLDSNVTQYDRVGKAIMNLPNDSPAVLAVADILKRTYGNGG
jgi:CO dehydrogenase maturation factor